jgi:ABC-type transport system involved in Fe-S cluster assembly fused permease/ATPase subunit
VRRRTHTAWPPASKKPFIYLFLFHVAQATRRRIQLGVLRHLHALSHHYHTSRKTGAVLHVVEPSVKPYQRALTQPY